MDDRTSQVERLEAVLTDPALADRVEMVVRRLDDDTYRAASVDGTVEFTRAVDVVDDDGPGHIHAVTATSGRNPLSDRRTDHLVGHATERAAAQPPRHENAYPHAFESISQFFDAPDAPDLLATHTAAHHTDSHLGQHGSLGVIQARAPFIAAGAGLTSHGLVPRSTRVVDIAPTIAAVLGLDPHPDAVGSTGTAHPSARLRRQDGAEVPDLVEGTASHVVVLLLDGCNANLLQDVIAAGEAPHLAELVGRGTSFEHGAMASLPTATLANHTTAVTGAHPGHSGVLHNTWLDRTDGSTTDLLSMDQMFWAARHLAPGVETLFEAVTRSRPGAFTSATFEFCDRGATFSSFGLVRDRTAAGLPRPDEVDHMDPDAAAGSEAYRFMSRVDHLSTRHTVDVWNRVHGNDLPTLSWCSLAVTDEAGHESGPHGELARAAVRDSDARVGVVLGAVERAGALDRTAVFVIADHGMEQTDPAVDRDWSGELAQAGVDHREVGGGLIYLV